MKTLLIAAVVGAVSTLTASAPMQDDFERWLTIVNDTSVSLCAVYISRTSTLEWEGNRISSCIAPGESRTVDPGYQMGACDMDLEFVFDDTDVLIERNFNICVEEEYEITEEPDTKEVEV